MNAVTCAKSTDGSTIISGDTVIVRNDINGIWIVGVFSYKDLADFTYPFIVGDKQYRYCVPLKESNRHLIGTRMPCQHSYIPEFGEEVNFSTISQKIINGKPTFVEVIRTGCVIGFSHGTYTVAERCDYVGDQENTHFSYSTYNLEVVFPKKNKE